MSDHESTGDEAVGSVQIKVSPGAVHKAVRNILINEMGVSRATVVENFRDLIREVAEAKIETFCLSYLKDNNYGGAQIYGRVKAAMDRQINDLRPIIKDVTRELVHEAIKEDVEGVIGAIVRDGLKVRLGWNREVSVDVESAAHARKSWIPIGDRVPPEKATIIVYHGNVWNDGKEVGPATYTGTEFRSPSGGVLVKVTHWRQLPGRPE